MVSIDLKRVVEQIKSVVEFIFFPPRCAFCVDDCQSGQVFCSECMHAVRPIVSYDLPITTKYKVKVFAVSAYVDPLRKLIRSKRFSNRRASKLLGRLIVENILGLPQQVDVVVPIPLHWTRYARRGYNQAQVMGAVIAEHYAVDCVQLLRRKKMTAFQAGLEGGERIENVKNAFDFSKKNINPYKGKHILLVDDVMTTGATMSAAVKQLRLLQPAQITVVVACRVV